MSFIHTTDLWEFSSNLNFLNEAVQKINNAVPGVNTVRSIQNYHDVQLLRTLWNKVRNDSKLEDKFGV